MVKVKALWNLGYKGEYYQGGETFECDPQQAKTWEAQKKVKILTPEPTKPEPAPEVKITDYTVDQARELIAKETDMLQLDFWKQQELSQGKPRKTIIDLIETRGGVLASG